MMRFEHVRQRRGRPLAAMMMAAGLGVALPAAAQRPPAVRAEAGNAQAPRPATAPVKTQALKYDDDSAEGKRSLGASGHAVVFDRPADARFVEEVQIFASRYGHPEAPKEYWHLYILNDNQQVLADVPFAYRLIPRGEMKWYTLRTPSIEVPEKFIVALAFNPAQTKGIFLGYDESVAKTHSFTGLPDSGYKPVDGKYDWMVRVQLAAKPSGRKGVRLLANWKVPATSDPFAGCITVPAKLTESEDKQSYGGRGPAIDFTIEARPTGEHRVKNAASSTRIKGISLYASRYGSGYDPETTMLEVVLLDPGGEELWQGRFPYALFSYNPRWVHLVLPEPVELPSAAEEQLHVRAALDPAADQRKGIYFHYQKSPPVSHSLAGTVDGGFEAVPDREWLMQLHLDTGNSGPATQPAGQ